MRSIITLLCKQYVILIAVAIAVAVPLSHFFVSNWLDGFAYHITLEWMFFIVPSLLMIIITLALVGSQSFKAAITNPTDSLKYE